jgi:hypothetical protein
MVIHKVMFFCALIVGASNLSGASTQPLSVVEALNIIWKMNYNDISTAHSILFNQTITGKKKPRKITEVASYIYSTRSKMSAWIWGKPLITQILETFISATTPEQTIMLKAVEGSYDEYISFNRFGVLAALLVFPIGIPLLMLHHSDHIKKIEAQRAAL